MHSFQFATGEVVPLADFGQSDHAISFSLQKDGDRCLAGNDGRPVGIQRNGAAKIGSFRRLEFTQEICGIEGLAVEKPATNLPADPLVQMSDLFRVLGEREYLNGFAVKS